METTKVFYHFFGLAVTGSLLIIGSAYITKRRHVKNLSK